MDELSVLLRELRSRSGTVFALRNRRSASTTASRGAIVDDQQKEAWGLFSPGAAFFRRVAFASLLLLAGLGSFLVSRESSFVAVPMRRPRSSRSTMPSRRTPKAADRDRMLVTLATYHE